MTTPTPGTIPRATTSACMFHLRPLSWLVIVLVAATYGPVKAQEPEKADPNVASATASGSETVTDTKESVVKDDAAVPDEGAATVDDLVAKDGTVRFAFEGVPWRDVIKWIADESDLALHVGEVPTGSFTYSDPSSFTFQEAMDRINLFLLPEGFTLVRSGKLLSVINLGDPRSMQQLDALAKAVTIEQLVQLNDHDVVKCFFPLGELPAEDAVQELSALNLMTTPAVFNKTNQLLITDTAGKLKSVKAILDSFQPSELSDGTVVKSFALKHVSAEDLLLVIRPHLGLATDEMIGIDVSLSADLQGKHLFVTGVEDKVKMIEGLVTAIDVPDESMSTTNGAMELRSHIVQGGNVETVYNVLQTLLAGKSVRLSMDETAGSVVALATPAVQAEITETVAQLQASEAEFEVIPLKTIDPYFAISLLEEMLDLPDPLVDEEIDPLAPKIDADPGNMRLFVRARKHQIEQIKKIIDGLDVSSGASSADDIRLFSLRGEQAVQILETAAKFWREPNPIFLYPSLAETDAAHTERVVNGDATNSALSPSNTVDTSSARLLTTNTLSQAPAIRCQLTPRGLLVQSVDTEALDTFEEHLRMIAGPDDSIPSPPIIFYLKYSKPDAAIRMLAELLDGGESAREGEAGSLVNAFVSSGSSGTYLGSLVSSREGTTTLIAGSITVVADSRLNRLIAQGTAGDIERIESYLKIIDKDSSITSVEVYGTTHVIELLHTRASEVADAIRDAYGDRIATNTGRGQPGQSGSPQQADRAAIAARIAAEAKGQSSGKKNTPSRSAAGQSQDLEPKMTVAVHEPSNSLIVTAPDQLFQEVEQLVKLIDSRSEEAVQVISISNSEAVRSSLEQFFSGSSARRTSGSSSSKSRPTTTRPTPTRPTTSRPTPTRPTTSARVKSGR